MVKHQRRAFLQVGAAGWLGSMIGRSLAADASRSKPKRNMILVWLGGGPSTIDMWDPKPDAPDYIRGEFATIETAVPGVRIGEHLPSVAKVMDRCSILRSLSHSIPAHGPGAQYVLTGHLPTAASNHPSLGSIAARLLGSAAAIPPYVAFQGPSAGAAGYLGSAWNPFEIETDERTLPRGVALHEDADRPEFSSRVRLRNAFDDGFDSLESDPVIRGLDTFHEQAVGVLVDDSIRTALDLQRESEELRGAFGERSSLGRQSLRAVRLIEAGARFVTVGTDGWDTHSNNFSTLRNRLLPQLDTALAALITTLESRGLLESTIVCCCGEFGRTPNVNGNAGRDHWSRAMSLLLAGGGFQAGVVHGATDKHGGEPVDGKCTPADLAATLLSQIGIRPDTKISSPSGREQMVAGAGRVIDELVSRS